ncbi:molybdopterin molybdotransferase MoeA [bacterium]|nr:molybdopterin molybdotransferase MoeA [bacterium]
MITFEQAQNIVFDNIKTLDPEFIEITRALGYYTAVDLISNEVSPPFDNSAMDGYAVRYEDIKNASMTKPIKLVVTDNIPAGYFTEKKCNLCEAMRIMTGAPIPEGADTIIPLESTRVSGDFVDILIPEKKGKFIRKKGGDVKEGDVLCSKGTLIRAQEQALLGSVGKNLIEVIKKPSIAILSTGSELVNINENTDMSKIRDVNSILLHSLVFSAGGEPIILNRVADDFEVIEKALIDGLNFDMLITSGGVSVGDHDYVKDVLEKIGFKILFWKVKIKPGLPLLFGVKDKTFVIGLPGNSVSCFVSFEMFIKPSIKKMMGAKDYSLKKLKAKLQNDVENISNRDEFMRGYSYRDQHDLLFVETYMKQESNILESLCKANVLVRIPAERRYMKRFEDVDIYPIDSL